MRAEKLPMKPEEYQILRKYEEPRKVDPEDKKTLEDFSLIGWVLWGFNNKEGFETAVLPEDVKFILERRYSLLFEK